MLVALIRFRLLDIPLERDEGGFAQMGHLMLQGIPPYLKAYNMKLPGIYAAYALLMGIFGQSTEGIHFGLIVMNAATVVTIFLIARHLFDLYSGLVAGASYAILSLSPTVLGTAAHATHFVLLPALGGIFLMLKGLDSGRRSLLFWSGLCLGVSFLMKQPGLSFAAFALLYIAFRFIRRTHPSPKSLTEAGIFYGAGVILPFVLTCAALWITGVFEKFWLWTFGYAMEYGFRIPLSMGSTILLNQFPKIIGKFYLLWAVSGLGILALFVEKEARRSIVFVLGFFLFSFLAVCPGFYFREHYFVLLLPAISLLIGIAFGSLRRFLRSTKRKKHWFHPSCSSSSFCSVFFSIDRSSLS